MNIYKKKSPHRFITSAILPFQPFFFLNPEEEQKNRSFPQGQFNENVLPPRW